MRLPLVNETFSWEIVSLFLISIFMQESPVYQQRPELEELYLVVSVLCVAVTALQKSGSYSYTICSKSIQHVYASKYNCTINRVVSYSKQLYPCFYKLLNFCLLLSIFISCTMSVARFLTTGNIFTRELLKGRSRRYLAGVGTRMLSIYKDTSRPQLLARAYTVAAV